MMCFSPPVNYKWHYVELFLPFFIYNSKKYINYRRFHTNSYHLHANCYRFILTFQKKNLISADFILTSPCYKLISCFFILISPYFNLMSALPTLMSDYLRLIFLRKTQIPAILYQRVPVIS